MSSDSSRLLQMRDSSQSFTAKFRSLTAALFVGNRVVGAHHRVEKQVNIPSIDRGTVARSTFQMSRVPAIRLWQQTPASLCTNMRSVRPRNGSTVIEGGPSDRCASAVLRQNSINPTSGSKQISAPMRIVTHSRGCMHGLRRSGCHK